MKLRTKCTSCKDRIVFNESIKTRPDLEMKRGEVFQLNCDKCGSNQNTHINDVEAVENTSIILIAFGISILLSAVLYFVFGAIATVVIVVPLLMWNQHTSSIHAFNVYRMPRRK